MSPCQLLEHIMLRGDIVMRKKRGHGRLWYNKRHYLKYYRGLLGITTILLIFSFLWIYVLTCLFPVGLLRYENDIYEKVKITVKNELVSYGSFNDSYDGILEIKKDSEGRIVSAKADNMKLSNLSTVLDKKLENILILQQGEHYDKITAHIIPILNMQVHLGGAKITDVQTKYVTDFSPEGANKTRLKVLVNVNITYEYLLGKRTRTYEFILLDALLEGT